MTTTQNLHLPQWEAEDRIMRTDFNAAMASIDAGVAEKASIAALAEKANASALTALQNSLPKFATGTYTGDGTTGRTIVLGFKPKLVFLSGSSSNSALLSSLAFWVDGSSYCCTWSSASHSTNATTVTIVENGFSLTHSAYHNISGKPERYFVVY